MPSRPYWKGHVRLSLVTFAVALYPAINATARLAFHQIDRKSGQRVREQKVVPGQGDVAAEDIVKGYEVEKGRYVLLEDEDFEKVRVETQKTIELTGFFPERDLAPIYVDKPYFVAPDGPLAGEAYSVMRDAMADSGRAALGRVVMSGRERLVALTRMEKGFVLYTLHSAEMVRKPQHYFEDVPDAEVDDDLLAVAKSLIERKAGAFDPSKFVDRYQEALQDVIRQKLAGQEPFIASTPAPASNVVDLMEALKKSLAQGEDKGPPDGGKKGRGSAGKEAGAVPDKKPAKSRKRA